MGRLGRTRPVSRRLVALHPWDEGAGPQAAPACAPHDGAESPKTTPPSLVLSAGGPWFGKNRPGHKVHKL